MADFVWPDDLAPFKQAFYLQPHTGGSESPFTRQSKIYGLSAPRWICSIELRGGHKAVASIDPKRELGRRVDAFLAQVQGRLNRVQLWDFRRPGAARAFGNAAATAGTSTITLTGAAEGDILVGEYVGGDGRPHIITALEVSGADLAATVKPHWEADIAVDEATFEKVAGFFRLVSDDAGTNPTQRGELTHYALDFVEDWGPSTDVIYEGETVTFSG